MGQPAYFWTCESVNSADRHQQGMGFFFFFLLVKFLGIYRMVKPFLFSVRKRNHRYVLAADGNATEKTDLQAHLFSAVFIWDTNCILVGVLLLFEQLKTIVVTKRLKFNLLTLNYEADVHQRNLYVLYVCMFVCLFVCMRHVHTK